MNSAARVALGSAIAATVAVAGWAWMHLAPHRIEQERVQWQQKVTEEIPVGSSSDAILNWGTSRGVVFIKPDKGRLSAIIERIKDGLFEFPCSEWQIRLEITLDPGGRSIAQTVRPIGICL